MYNGVRSMKYAIIGGTGIDEMPEFAAGTTLNIKTRFGEATLIEGKINSNILYFLPRHGCGHNTSPSQINYRAQIAALKSLNVSSVVGVCAVGSLRTDIEPGSMVVFSDFIDMTRRRITSFFDEPGEPLVHTDFTTPYCPWISQAIVEACEAVGVDFHSKGVYLGVDGPRYETPAEVKLYATWGGDVVGMTNVPEVILAREAGICYGAIGIATNLACGLGMTPLSHDDVRAAVANAQEHLSAVLHKSITNLAGDGNCTCATNTSLIL